MTWLWVTLAVLLDGALVLVAGVLRDHWLDRYRGPMLGFATGTLLASGLGELLPEAVARDGSIALATIAGTMIALGIVERVSARGPHHRDRPILPVALLGSDALHNLGDGMAIAAAFLVEPRIGIVTSAAVMLHELPEEIADYALLRAAGMARRRALVWLVVVQLTAGIGAAATLLASSLIADIEGMLVAIACGMFLYIALIALLPELWRVRSRGTVIAVVVGAAITLAIG
jgi:zinc and cadmium transporter